MQGRITPVTRWPIFKTSKYQIINNEIKNKRKALLKLH